MRNSIAKLVRRWRCGEAVVIVSGLPRSGTSMLMNMLAAGGLPLMADGVRAPDDDNPKGYFELERVRNLENERDKSWVREARGKALKVISHLLKELPDGNIYRVILLHRDLREVVASQNLMLECRGELNPVDDDEAIELYEKHLANVKVLADRKPNFELLEVSYEEVLQNPPARAELINAFLGGGLDPARMAAVVDCRLYRNRKERVPGRT